MRIIQRQHLKKAEAEAAIGKETAQLLMGRLFDLKTGKPLVLPDGQKQGYSADAAFFAKFLHDEAAAEQAKVR